MPTLAVKGTKRSLSSDQPSGRSPKRIHKTPVPEPDDDVIIIEDSDHENPDDLKEILAQIKEQEDSERLTRQLETDYVPSPSGSKAMPIDIEDDAAMARQLAEEWALEDSMLEMNHEENADSADSSDVEFLPGPSSNAMPIDIEDDAAMARQLAEQWASEDSMLEMNHEENADSFGIEFLPGPSSNTKVQRHAEDEYPNAGTFNSTSSKLADPKFYKLANVRPDAALEPFKQFFTISRNCSKCSKDVKSPRGSVSVLHFNNIL